MKTVKKIFPILIIILLLSTTSVVKANEDTLANENITTNLSLPDRIMVTHNSPFYTGATFFRREVHHGYVYEGNLSYRGKVSGWLFQYRGYIYRTPNIVPHGVKLIK